MGIREEVVEVEKRCWRCLQRAAVMALTGLCLVCGVMREPDMADLQVLDYPAGASLGQPSVSEGGTVTVSGVESIPRLT